MTTTISIMDPESESTSPGDIVEFVVTADAEVIPGETKENPSWQSA